jgi:hypothetical protein
MARGFSDKQQAYRKGLVKKAKAKAKPPAKKWNRNEAFHAWNDKTRVSWIKSFGDKYKKLSLNERAKFKRLQIKKWKVNAKAPAKIVIAD